MKTEIIDQRKSLVINPFQLKRMYPQQNSNRFGLDEGGEDMR